MQPEGSVNLAWLPRRAGDESAFPLHRSGLEWLR